MKLCPYCGNEAGGIGAGDEFLDYCSECEVIIEGQTVDAQTEKERQVFKFSPLMDWALSWRDFA